MIPIILCEKTVLFCLALAPSLEFLLLYMHIDKVKLKLELFQLAKRHEMNENNMVIFYEKRI